jgi:hypothetical protein
LSVQSKKHTLEGSPPLPAPLTPNPYFLVPPSFFPIFIPYFFPILFFNTDNQIKSELENEIMKLHFLGQTYSASNYQVKTAPSAYTARFLGQIYTPSLPLQPIKSQLGLRKYRGVVYGDVFS